MNNREGSQILQGMLASNHEHLRKILANLQHGNLPHRR